TDHGSATSTVWTQQTEGISYANMSAATILLALSHPSSLTSEIVYALLPNTSGAFDLFRTTNGGTNWSKRKTSSSAFYVIMGVDAMDWNTVYLGGQLFWISADGGDNFIQVPASGNDRQPASAHGDYWELVVDPKDPAILYAGSDGGIFRSTDHGKKGTWHFIGEGITNVEMYDLALANTWSSRAISGVQDNGVILYNGNLVWQQISGGDGAAVAIDATNPNRFYAVRNNSGTPNVSSDGGGTFADFSNGLPKDPKGRTPCYIFNMTSHLLIHPLNSKTLLEPCQSLWRTTTNDPQGNWVSILPPPTGEEVVRSAVDPKFNIYYAGTDHGHIYAGLGGSGLKQVFPNPESLSVSDIEVDKAHPDTIYVSFAPPYWFPLPQPFERNCSANAGTHRIYQLKTQI